MKWWRRPKARTYSSCGRYHLEVDGIVLVTAGQERFDSDIPWRPDFKGEEHHRLWTNRQIDWMRDRINRRIR